MSNRTTAPTNAGLCLRNRAERLPAKAGPHSLQAERSGPLCISRSRLHLRIPWERDSAGRDVLTRLLAGGAGLAGHRLPGGPDLHLSGLAAGCVAGFYRGVADFLTLRLTEIILSFRAWLPSPAQPPCSGRAPSYSSVVLSLFSWPTPCLIVRAMTLSIRNVEYVTAARAAGASNARIVLFDVVPAVLSPLTVFATVAVAQAILAEAGLSFLGFGVPPPDASWGTCSTRPNRLRSFPVSPGSGYRLAFLIATTVLSINLVGDGLRDAVDHGRPKVSRVCDERPSAVSYGRNGQVPRHRFRGGRRYGRVPAAR